MPTSTSPITNPKFPSKNLLHTSVDNKHKDHPSMNHVSSINHENIQREELPSPSHKVLASPHGPCNVEAHSGIAESVKKLYIHLDVASYQPDIATFRHEGAHCTMWGAGEMGLQQKSIQKQCRSCSGTSL